MDYRAAIPVRRYEDFRKDIDRIARGENHVLTSEPVRRFFVTSGSTGVPKLVPVTASFIRHKADAFQLFWASVREAYPTADPGGFIFNFSDSGGDEQQTPAGIPCCSETSFWNACWRGAGSAMAGQSPLLRTLANIAEAEQRHYAIARILMEIKISILMSLNPSTLLLLFQTIQKNASELIADVGRGGISARTGFTQEFRDQMRRRFKPNKAHAKVLETVFADTKPAYASAIWPTLQVLVCWRSPMVRPYIELLRGHVGAVSGRDYVSMASEGILAIPYQDEVSGGVLPIKTHFYEFIPEESAEEADPETLLPHELELGKKYVVVLSTSAGLYRYNIGDTVRVQAFTGTTPVIEFLHRVGRTCSLTGEKLTESQVAESVRAAANRTGIDLQAFTMCPAAHPFPHYKLLTETAEHYSHATLSNFLAAIDEELASQNLEYRAKRASSRLGAPELLVVPQGSHTELRQVQIRNGANESQIKATLLSSDFDLCKQFEVLERVACESAA